MTVTWMPVPQAKRKGKKKKKTKMKMKIAEIMRLDSPTDWPVATVYKTAGGGRPLLVAGCLCHAYAR